MPDANRVLNDLLGAGYVERKAGMRDRRTRRPGLAIGEQLRTGRP